MFREMDASAQTSPPAVSSVARPILNEIRARFEMFGLLIEYGKN